MKSYTDIEQSKKLAEILPIESADAHYVRTITDFMGNPVDGKWSDPKLGNPEKANYIVQNFTSYEKIPAWSLSALLEWLKLNVKGFIHLQLLGGKYFASWYSPSYAMVEPKFDEKVSEIETYEHNTPISAVIDLIEQLKKAMKGGEE